MTLFFRARESPLAKLQTRKQADSRKLTTESFKVFLIARSRTPANAEVAIQKISDELSRTDKEGKLLRRESEKPIGKQGVRPNGPDDQHQRSISKLKENLEATRQQRLKGNGLNQPKIPARLFSKMFDKAVKEGKMVRVNP